MRPRLLFRTHYQVDEPAYLEMLVKRCTSPVQSSYDETVARKLSGEIQRRGKDFNIAAASYALDLAHGVSLVNDQNVWTDKGHLVNLVADVGDRRIAEEVELSTTERLLHLRMFMEADGAAIQYLARYLLEHDRMPNSDEDWNEIAKSMFLQIFGAYLDLTSNTADRVALRTEIDRLRTKGYSGKTGSHKMFVHLQLMARVGLVSRTSRGGSREYRILGTGLRDLMEQVPTVVALEELARENDWLRVVARSLGVGTEGEMPTDREYVAALAHTYRAVMSTGISICPLSTLLEALQLRFIAERSLLVGFRPALTILERIQRDQPRDVRFHVDRRGKPAFLKLSDGFVDGAFAAP